MTIRPARPEDFPRLREILLECGQASLDGPDYTTFSPLCLVAERAGILVGFIQCLLGKPYSVMTELAVAPEWQRRGIAYRLWQHMETVLREYGVMAWVGFVVTSNKELMAIYDRLGFQRTGQGEGYVRRLT